MRKWAMRAVVMLAALLAGVMGPRPDVAAADPTGPPPSQVELEQITVVSRDIQGHPLATTIIPVHQVLGRTPLTVPSTSTPTLLAASDEACRTVTASVHSYDLSGGRVYTHYRYHYEKTWCVHGLPPTHFYAEARAWFSDVDDFIPYGVGWQVGGLVDRAWYCRAWKDNIPGEDRCMVHNGWRQEKAVLNFHGQVWEVEYPLAGVESGLGLDYRVTAYIVKAK